MGTDQLGKGGVRGGSINYRRIVLEVDGTTPPLSFAKEGNLDPVFLN